MRTVLVSGGYTASVDDADFELVSQHGWCLLKGGGNRQRLYAQANIKIDGVWRRVLMHRFIMDAPPDQRCDHKDNNGLNNQRDNLRLATRGQNQHNSGSRRGRFKGVSWKANANKWVAQIMANRVHYYLGVFSSEEDAARAYDTAAKELHGEFARINFPGTLPDAEPRDSMRRELLDEVNLAVNEHYIQD